MFIRSCLHPILFIMIASLLSFSVIAGINNTSNQGMDTITLEDKNDVSSAVAEIKSELEQQGFIVPLVVNHSAAASRVDLELAPIQVIFARPPRLLEKRLLRKSKTIGLDLPLKFLIFKDAEGNVKLSVNTLGYLLDRHKIRTRDFVLRLTNKLISQFGTSDKERQGLISVESSQSIDDTVQTLQDAISANPAVSIPLVLDYGNSTTKEDHKRHRRSFPKLIVFGNPNVGTPLMQADPRMGIDLPLKLLVWKDTEGQVNITYNNPHFIAGRINLQGQDARLNAIAKNLNKLALIGAGKND
ncbi:MAG: DUF302 domain-containing protein [Methylococcales bacterium]|nr:DUF302 domain-containing protein [Methylococcales bacterium]